jgi:hypothetical protein
VGEPTEPRPVKLIAGLLAGDEADILSALEKLKEAFGPTDLLSRTLPFEATHYYEKEMGEGLLRRWASFAMLLDPGRLAEVKLATNEIERTFARRDGRRSVNIDPGYVTLGNLVLATTKNRAHRVYLGKGIYAEVTLIWARGDFRELEWTYPDYQSDIARDFFRRVRQSYRYQVRAGGVGDED